MYNQITSKIIDFFLNQNPDQLTKTNIFLDKECTQIQRNVSSIFPLTFALHAISSLSKENKTPEIENWINETASYLETQQYEFSFNYWTRKSNDIKTHPLPDDLDDTSLALSALTLAKREISEKYFLKIITQETKPGGPYKTWFIDKRTDTKNIWSDIDPVVNANLLYFVALNKVSLPNTEKYIFESIKNNQINSKYYPSNLTLYFYLARYLSINKNEELIKLILQKLKEYKYTKLDTADKLFFLLIQVYLEKRVDPKYLKQILLLQNKAGSFPEIPICYDFSLGDKKTYLATPVITSSLVLELISKMEKPSTIKSVVKTKKVSTVQKYQNKFISEYISKSPLSKEIKNYIGEVKLSHTSLVMPELLLREIKGSLSKSETILIAKISTSLYIGWQGYTLFDDILDKQADTSMIPIALELINIYNEINSVISDIHPLYKNAITKALSTCNKAYYFEVKKANITVENIPERIEAYLATLRVLPEIFSLSFSKGELIYKIFKNIYIINQLNDDSHDWQEDIENNRNTYVTQLIAKTKSSNQELVFWQEVMPKVIKLCEKRYLEAKESIDALSQSKTLLKILDNSIGPILKAKNEREKVKNLLKNFN